MHRNHDQQAGRILQDPLVQSPPFTDRDLRPRDGRRIFLGVTLTAAELRLTPDRLLELTFPVPPVVL